MTTSDTPEILIVEDNAIMADVLRRAIQHAGLSVQIARNGQKALDLPNIHTFNAIVTDYQMPEMDGMEFIARLRADERTRDLPVILVSGKGLELDTVRLEQQYRVYKVMFKPFSPRELIDSLLECLAPGRTPVPEQMRS